MYVGYLRVSTGKQANSGLSLDAQRRALVEYAASKKETILEIITEVESGSINARPALVRALELCKRRKAVLLIARLDRLSRSLAFIAQLLEANVEIRAADVPEANRLMLQMLAVFAEHERQVIRERTKAALASAKARGVRLGAHGAVLAAAHKADAIEFATSLHPALQEARSVGCRTTREIAAYWNQLGLPTRELGRWHPASVARVLRRSHIQLSVALPTATPRLERSAENGFDPT